jgi:Asp-tRNA(Asn)/Glu-tRNA(Gln) amidotransferase A subunit family amidase
VHAIIHIVRAANSVNESPISVETIAAAEHLAGVAYTDAERAAMLDNIAAQIDLARKRRAHSLPIDLAPATRFDPRLPHWKARDVGPFAPMEPAPAPLPTNEEDIAFASVASLSAWIRTRAITSTRLTEIYLDRIARFNPKLKCFATVTSDLALTQAGAADQQIAKGVWLGPLHGIPWGCKDILDTAGFVTGWGAEPYQGRIPDKDAAVVERLAAAGAVMLGKTTVGALAYGDIWYGGRTANPWNVEEGSSGSSAGSASATAAGLVAFSLGTETLGSIVAPSLRCGTTGLRPTFGRVPRSGAMPLCWTLDKIGPICRSVVDTALVLNAISFADPTDPYNIPAPFGFQGVAPINGLRLGYYPNDFEEAGIDDLDRAALDAARNLGLELVPLERPDLPYGSLMSVLTAEAAASFEEMTLSDADDTLTWQEPGAWPNTFRKARFLSAIDHIQLDRLRRRVMQDMDAAFAGVDAMIGPCLIGPMLIITNFTGHPCLVLRCGFRSAPTRSQVSLARARLDQGDETDGPQHIVPHGICLWGRLFDEGPILQIGAALEQVFAVADRRPPL